MGPDKLLSMLRGKLAALEQYQAELPEPQPLKYGTWGWMRYVEKLESFVNDFNDLDEWLSKGGFLPRPWSVTVPLIPKPITTDDASEKS